MNDGSGMDRQLELLLLLLLFLSFTLMSLVGYIGYYYQDLSSISSIVNVNYYMQSSFSFIKAYGGFSAIESPSRLHLDFGAARFATCRIGNSFVEYFVSKSVFAL